MSPSPRLVIVMGVSGAGKSTVGAALAEKIDAPFIDADHLHDARAIAKMRGGLPLEDADRWPWLGRVAREMRRVADGSGLAVCACSALKRAYRDTIRDNAGERVLFVLLDGDRAVIAQRQANRPGHYMPAKLLDSQFATLERFEADEDGMNVDVTLSLAQQVERIANSLA